MGIDTRTRKRLYMRARRHGHCWDSCQPVIDLTDMDRLATHARAHHHGGETIGTFVNGRVRAVLLDRNLNPIGLRVMRDLRADTDPSTFDSFVDTARGRVDGKTRFTARLIRFWGEVGDDTLSLVGIMAESSL